MFIYIVAWLLKSQITVKEITKEEYEARKKK